MFGLNPWIIVAIVLAFVGSNTYSYTKGHSNGTEKERAVWVVEQARLDKLAQEAILAEKDRVIAKERELVDLKMTVEVESAERERYVNGMRIANGRLVKQLGGLFDKNGRPSPQGGQDGAGASTAAVGGGNAAGAGCMLSDSVAENLLDLARDADRVRSTARACQAELTGITKILNDLAAQPAP